MAEPQDPIQTLVAECLVLETRGDFTTAFQKARQALELADAKQYPAAWASALLAVARIRFRFGQYDQVRSLARQALEALPEDQSDHLRQRMIALILIGVSAGETNSLDEAEIYLRQAIDLNREVGDALIRARTLHNLSTCVYLTRGQFELALQNDIESARVSREHQLEDFIHFPLVTLAWNYQISGQYASAEATLAELSQTKSYTSPISSARLYHHYIQANILLARGELEEAHQLYNQVYAALETGGDPGINVEARLGLSHYRRLSGEPGKALEWANEALLHAQRAGYVHKEGQSLIERGRAHQDLGEWDAAEGDYRAALATLEILPARFDMARAALFLAALSHAKKSPRAPADFQEAVQRIQAGGYLFLLDQERASIYPLLGAYINSRAPDLVETCQRLLQGMQNVPPPALSVELLGGYQLRVGGRPVEKRALRQRKAGELLALLLLEPTHRLAVEKVIEALWPEKDLESATGSLHQSTSALRRLLEPELPEKFPSRYVAVEDEQVILYLPADSQLDTQHFERLCAEGNWQKSLELYQGDLLPGYPYADWLALPRQQLAHRFQQALLGWAEGCLARGDYAAALQACRRLLASEPWHEGAVLCGMNACLGMNDRAGAMRLYKNLQAALRKDLGVEPQPEIRALFREISKIR